MAKGWDCHGEGLGHCDKGLGCRGEGLDCHSKRLGHRGEGLWVAMVKGGVAMASGEVGAVRGWVAMAKGGVPMRGGGGGETLAQQGMSTPPISGPFKLRRGLSL